jgi:hypothetical protein
MSKNITLFGQDYANVPAINVPLQGGGTAKFIDEDDAGGGGGDFSTAQVTIDNSNNQGSYPPIYGSIIDSYNQGGFPPTLVDCTGGEIAPYDPIQTYTVILYKGKAKVNVVGSGLETITVSGNVTDLGSTTYLITGDGTITISQ